eukprot:scaffold9132_cov112-Isochrysis_galbana.AAC.5
MRADRGKNECSDTFLREAKGRHASLPLHIRAGASLHHHERGTTHATRGVRILGRNSHEEDIKTST